MHLYTVLINKSTWKSFHWNWLVRHDNLRIHVCHTYLSTIFFSFIFKTRLIRFYLPGISKWGIQLNSLINLNEYCLRLSKSQYTYMYWYTVVVPYIISSQNYVIILMYYNPSCMIKINMQQSLLFFRDAV